MTARPPVTASLKAFLFALFGLAMLTGLSYLSSRMNVRPSFGMSQAYTVLFQVLALALPTVFFYRKNPDLRPCLRLRRMDPLCAVLVAFAALFGVLALNWISLYWTLLLNALGLVTSTGNSAAPRTLSQLLMMLGATAIAPALCEELLFRGFLLPSLEPQGETRAALLSGAMFALLHGRIEALPAHLLLGAMLGLLVVRTGSLPAAMLYHAVYNAAIMTAAYFSHVLDPESLYAMPTFSESLLSLPTAAALVAVWLLLAFSAMRRGQKTKAYALPPAERTPLSKAGKALLLSSGALLLLVELRALLAMLPGGTP